MHISPNLIRFPAPAVTPTRAAEIHEPADNVVAFPKSAEADDLSQWSGAAIKLQEYGQIFAAHRSVGRIADALEAIPLL